MRVFAVLMIVLLAFVAQDARAQAAHGFNFCWVDPVQRVDGTPLDPATELAGYTLQVALRDGGFVDGPLVSVYVSRADTQAQETGQYDRCYFWADAVQQGGWYDARMNTMDVNELTSNFSNVVTVRKLAVPRPPNLR